MPDHIGPHYDYQSAVPRTPDNALAHNLQQFYNQFPPEFLNQVAQYQAATRMMPQGFPSAESIFHQPAVYQPVERPEFHLMSAPQQHHDNHGGLLGDILKLAVGIGKGALDFFTGNVIGLALDVVTTLPALAETVGDLTSSNNQQPNEAFHTQSLAANTDFNVNPYGGGLWGGINHTVDQAHKAASPVNGDGTSEQGLEDVLNTVVGVGKAAVEVASVVKTVATIADEIGPLAALFA